MLSRRRFVKSLAAAGAFTAMNPRDLFAAPIKKDIGLQLYSIRDLVKADLAGCLEKLAKIGYTTIEAAGYGEGKFYGLEPAAFRLLVMNTGMNPISSHSGLTLENIQKTIDDTAAAGMKYLVQPSLPQSRRQHLDDYRSVAEELNTMGELCNAAGLTLGYHNHAFEFEKIDGEIPYDLLLQNTDSELVTMQLDTFWVFYGGYQPTDYLNKYPGRFKLWHIKDMAEGDDRESTEIGNGILDFPSIFELRKKAGMEYFFLEQEGFAMDPWESLAISWKYLNNL